MKVIAFLLLLVTAGCHAEGTNGIARRVFEKDRDKDGKADFRVESVFRGKQRVMVVWSKPNTNGVWLVTSRAFFAGDDMVAIEADEDTDGLVETLVVYRSGTKDIEVFNRRRDGSVQPVSTRTLRAFEKEHAAISDFADAFFDKNGNPDKLDEAIRETQKKVREAQQEKADEKK